tara:strand:- start:158 stop:277 length:120 start_codon:yes stop_codon:yes gene_type:complete
MGNDNETEINPKKQENKKNQKNKKTKKTIFLLFETLHNE